MNATEHKIKNILIYLIPSLLGNVLPILVLPIVTRFLTPKDFGIAALLMSSTTLIVSIISCNIDAATQRYYFVYRKDSQELGSLIHTGAFFLVCVWILCLPIIYLFSNSLSKLVLGDVSYSGILLIAYIGCCASILVTYFMNLFRNMEEAKLYAFGTSLQVISNSLLTLIFAVLFKLGYFSIVYAFLISSLGMSIWLSIYFLRRYPFSFSYSLIKDNLIYGIPLIPSYFTGAVGQFLDKYLLRNIVSLSSTGLYSLAQNLANKFFIFMTAVQSTYNPLFMKDMFDNGIDGAKAVGRNFTVFTYISLSALVFGVLFAEDIIFLLAPPSYSQMINVFLVLLGGVATQTFGKILGLPLAYAKKAYLAFPISIITVLINVGLNLLLIPIWHEMGAGVANVCSILGTNAIYIVVSQRYYPILFEKRILGLIYGYFTMITCSLLIFRSYPELWLWKYSFKVLAIFLYARIGVYAHILTKEKVKLMFSFLNPFRILAKS